MPSFHKFLLFVGLISTSNAWFNDAGNDKVLLRDVSTITLHSGKMTTGRRSSPVSQLQCVGGSASCKFQPKVVQCKNMGSDGFDVQWKCETDMDDSYRFGKVQVSCEGYNNPNDPYILKGSCGLEYTIDYTEAGNSRQDSGSNYYSNHNTYNYNKSKSGGSSWWIIFLILGGIGFLIHMMSSRNNAPDNRRGPNDFRGSNFRGGNSNQPPPYGFKPEYTQSASAPPPSYDDATNHNHHDGQGTHTRTEHHTHHHTRGNNQGGGFWTGMGLGGLGGYLFGSRRRNNYGYANQGWGNSWGGNRGWGHTGSSWGNTGSTWGNTRSSWGGGSSSRSSSSGTSRTTSGYGGTSRR